MGCVSHTERRRVEWVDTDAGGRIHFTVAFRWAEAAETSLRVGLGLLDDWGDYPRRHVEAEYLAVLRFADEVAISIGVERVGRTSITWAWEIARDGDVCIRGRHTVVHVDPAGRPAELPAQVSARLSG